MTRGRIIAGEVFDAEAAAQRLRAEADAEVARARAVAAEEVAAAHRERDRIAADAARLATEAPAPIIDEVGSVTEVVGLVMRARVPGLRLGEVVHVERGGAAPLPAEVVGFRGDDATLLPLAATAGVGPHARVWRTGRPLTIACGEALLGRVLDGLGQPIDGGGALPVMEAWPVDRAAPARSSGRGRPSPW
ncbi:MAG: hypothetical protein R2939_06475 [Kofleriaceae bacterium]